MTIYHLGIKLVFSDTDKAVGGAEKGQVFELITMAKYHFQVQHSK